MGESIAVIGLGQMGGAIAVRLHACGEDVVGYDVSAAARDGCAAQGLRVAPSMAEAVAGRTLVLTSLPNSASVDAVWAGPGGLGELAAPAQLCVELSSIDPHTMQRVAQGVAARGAAVLDCPVSGSPAEAGQGKLVLIVGGAPADVERARPVLSRFGETIRVAGPVGTGKVVKICNNMMSMANILVASEAFALGTRAGVDPAMLFDILSVSGGRSSQFLKRFPWAIERDFEPRFKMELGEKDLALGVDLGRACGMPTPVASVAREMYATALASGLRGRDIVALLQMYERWDAR
ncbi:MAG: NAD(P)-dependent oxidoreductase [Burkholderiaceae bacterium]